MLQTHLNVQKAGLVNPILDSTNPLLWFVLKHMSYLKSSHRRLDSRKNSNHRLLSKLQSERQIETASYQSDSPQH